MTTGDSFRCLGSREIEIRSSFCSITCREDPTTHSISDGTNVNALPPSSSGHGLRPALLIAFQVESKLQLQISDGTASLYQTDIHPSDAKILYQDDCDKVQVLAQHILSEMDGISLHFDDNDDALKHDGIKLAIRQRLETGIVKMIWSGILPNVTVASTTTGTCFPFLQTLGRTLRQEQERYRDLEDQCNTLHLNLQGWKDTAEKLSEDVWQSEKDALIQNFLELYRKTHDELRQTQLELQQLEDRHAARAGQSSYQQEVVVRRANARPAVTEQPDDQDELLYDRRTIDRLAAGPSQRLVGGAAAGGIMTKKARNQVSMEKGTKQTRSEPQPSDGTTSVQNLSLESEEQVTVGFRLTDVGVVSSAKELFQDMANRKRASIQDTPSTSEAKAIKKTKISDAVDNDRRKELEKMAAILGDDDDDDDDW
jgi:hypothetical protein